MVACSALIAACSPTHDADSPLTIAVPYEVGTLDPHARDLISEFAVLANLYEPLVRTSRNLTTLEPALAERWHNPSPETWIFELRREVVFHSGRPLRAADVVGTFRRLQETPELEIRSYLSDVLEVEATDPYTVRIVTRNPSGVFLNKLNFVLITPENLGQDLVRKPDGTGPYRFLSGDPAAGELHFERHDAYWGDPPELSRISFVLAQEPSDAFAALLEGRVGFAQIQAKGLADKLRAPALAERFEVVSQESLFVKYLAMDVAREVTPWSDAPRNPFLDPRVRRALHLGIDRHALAEALAEEATPAAQPVPRAVLGYHPGIELPHHDPGAARALLAEAGWEEGFGVTLHTRQILERPAQLLADQLATLGLRVEVAALEDAAFFELLEGGDMSLYFSRLGCPTGDASDVLERAFHSRTADGAFGRLNGNGYRNPAVDQAIEVAAALDTIEARRDALQAITAQVMEDLPWLPLYFDREVYAFERRLAWQPRSDSYVLAREISLR